jgi:hypothetical protein
VFIFSTIQIFADYKTRFICMENLQLTCILRIRMGRTVCTKSVVKGQAILLFPIVFISRT